MTVLSDAMLADRGLAYGQGLFETIRVQGGHAPLLDDHCQRLLDGARRLGLALPRQRLVQELTRAHARVAAGVVDGVAKGNAVIKLVLTGGAGGRGYASPRPARPQLASAVFPFRPRPPGQVRDGMVIGLCNARLADAGALAGLKHLARLEQVLAADEVRDHGWDEGLMLDARQRPLELTSMNLFARFGDRLWTPRLDHAGVCGVMRARIMRHWLPESGLALCQRPRLLAELRHADEVFACNAVAGVLPVRKLALWQWPVGDYTRSLQSTVDNWFVQP